MMAERHPDELDLLDLVEGELPRVAEASVSAHVEGCAECAATVRRLRAGRGALHASGVLQLSERGRDAITEAIDREAPIRPRRARYWEPRRLGLVLAMTLVLVASVVAVAQWGGVGGEAGGDAASELADDGGGGQESGGGADDAATPAPGSAEQRTFAEPLVAGPARAVAADLRADGFDARVVDGEVVVRIDRSAEEQRLQDALAERPPGDVVVRVEP